ncbi:MAG TPA: RNA polymerase sigma factor SigJ [Xanthobacteraceae bacterium]|nr:RNA polymerase sigma factor SigJ [Xanthobacteraceae bacterium]
MADPHATTFAQARPMLMGLAYRMLGSRADAEDAVQDTFLKWQSADKQAIENPPAWLTATCTRRCIDLLRAAHRSRVDYVGAWLPEPVHTSSDTMSEETPELASSLTTAFLLMLERLTPKERAAYLLHEIFDMDYADVATALGIQEPTCRKLVSRARTNIEQAKVRYTTPLERQEELLAAFQAAIASGSTGQLAALLADDIELRADGGGKVPAALDALRGKASVLDFIGTRLRDWWGEYEWTLADLNGSRGVVLSKRGETVATLSVAFDEAGQATAIYVVRNPDKLAALGGDAIA